MCAISCSGLHLPLKNFGQPRSANTTSLLSGEETVEALYTLPSPSQLCIVNEGSCKKGFGLQGFDLSKSSTPDARSSGQSGVATNNFELDRAVSWDPRGAKTQPALLFALCPRTAH